MVPLAKRLRSRGYQTQYWTYLTFKRPIREHGANLAGKLRRLAASKEYGKIHLVVHSMGSIVTRAALTPGLVRQLGAKLGRVVMIGPPNGGSHAATRLAPRYGWLAPNLHELSDRPDSFVNSLPGVPEGVEVGVLAASRDNVIHPDRTHLAGGRDHHTLTGWHTPVLWIKETADQAVEFLKRGQFSRA